MRRTNLHARSPAEAGTRHLGSQKQVIDFRLLRMKRREPILDMPPQPRCVLFCRQLQMMSSAYRSNGTCGFFSIPPFVEDEVHKEISQKREDVPTLTRTPFPGAIKPFPPPRLTGSAPVYTGRCETEGTACPSGEAVIERIPPAPLQATEAQWLNDRLVRRWYPYPPTTSPSPSSRAAG